MIRTLLTALLTDGLLYFFFYLNLVNYSYSVQSKDLGGRLYFYQLSLLGRKAS